MRPLSGLQRFLPIITLCLLAACGGGGGGTTTTQNNNTSNVSITLFQKSFQSDIAEGGQVDDLDIEAALSGDPATLNGKKILIVIEDVDQLFTGSPTIFFPTSSSVALHLTGNAPMTKGTRKGQMRVFACLDDQCATQITGSPMLVPYEVNVYSITIDPVVITHAGTFGDQPVEQITTVQLPFNQGSARALITEGGYNQSSEVLVAAHQGDISTTSGSVGVPLTFYPAKAGTYNGKVQLQGTFVTTTQKTVNFSKVVDLVYTVADNPAVDVVLWPSPIVINSKQGEPASGYQGLSGAVGRDGASFIPQTAQYLSAPPAAAGHPKENAWLFGTNFFVQPCDVTCLPVGTYTAVQPYLVTKPDTSQYVINRPITFNITP